MKLSIIEPGGLNVELAILFAANGHDVGYFTEYREAFPKGDRQSLGTGFPGVHKFEHISDTLDHGDIIICPDTHSCDYLQLAKKYGKPTWGAGRAERLEQDRLFAKQMLTKLGLPVGPYEHGEGLDSLENTLKRTKDRFVKFPGAYRGIAETKHHYDWEKTKREWWGELLSGLGPDQDRIPWISETPIKHVMEVAADQLTVNGEYSKPTLIGIEAKDSAYIGKIFAEPPECLVETNKKLTPYLRSCNAKTFFSPELMIGEDEKCYLTDPCLRTGHPVSAVQLRIYGDLCQYIIRAAMFGDDVKIKPTHKYGIALEVKSDQLDDGWLEIQFEEKRRHTVHLQCARKVKAAYYVIPKSFIAATIVGLGNTIDEAEKEIHKTLESFSCAGMSYDLNSIEKIKETMKKGEKCGIAL